jgi:hypothetical protein
LEEYLFLQQFNFPKALKQVNVKFDRLAVLDKQPKAIGASFSGGVDSFYLLYRHLNQNQPLNDYRVSHALFINGFDITRADRRKYVALFKNYRQLLAKFQIELIPLETNLASTVIPWLEYRIFYAPVLLGSALAYGGLFKRFIFSNSRHYTQEQVNSHPLADRLLSTEKLELVHFGATMSREQKLAAIHTWWPAQKALRVCGIPNQETANCCRCEKCVRTMLPLYALDSMQQFETFHDPLKSDRDTLRLARKFDPFSDHTPTNYSFFRRHKPALMPWLRTASFLGSLRFWLLRLLPEFLKRSLQRYGYYIDQFKTNYAFDNAEIIKLIESQTDQTGNDLTVFEG